MASARITGSGRLPALAAVMAGLHMATAEAAAPQRPFPQQLTYAAGTIKPNNRTQAQLNDDVRAFYDHWKSQYLKTAGVDGQGNALYRVSFGSGQPNVTVSEGQGYGMIITAFMAGYDADAQATFDGLLRFALAHPSSIDARLMNWHVPAQGGADCAFDGDADIAYALVLADAQWGSGGALDYASYARSRLDGLMASAIGPQSRLPMLGDWVSPNGSPHNQDTPRSSDFMPGHFRAWARFTGNTTWNTVAANSAAVITSIQANYSPATGLLPDFIRDARTAPKPAAAGFLEGSNDGNYYYNAGRDPLWLATDALLNGDAVSHTQARKMSEWARARTGGNPASLRAGFKLDGANISGNNYFTTFFAAPIAVAAMLEPAQQAWLNALYDSVRARHENYFEDSVNLLCLLVLSGNFWDPTLASGEEPTPYENWAESFGLNPATTGAPGADPDGDGQPNLVEFALHGDPVAKSSRGTSAPAPPAETPGGALIAIVIATRRGAVFAAAPDGGLTATTDGMTYIVQGSANLPDFTQPVQDGGATDTAPAGSGWPSLAGSDWNYHTFYLTRASLPAGKGFLRVTVSTPAP